MKRISFSGIFRKKHPLDKVFTPTTAAKLAFVHRNEIEKQIDKNLSIPGMQLIIYGHSGSGKTTLLANKLSKHCKNIIQTRCIKRTTVDDIIMDAFDKLNPFYVSSNHKSSTKSIGTSLKSEYLSLSQTVNFVSKKEDSKILTRIIPPQLTPQRLSEFLGAAGCVWVIEDFHKLRDEEKATFSQILKIFVDNANDYPQTRVIAIGAVDTAREIINYDKELANRIAEIHVPLMSNDELEQIIQKGQKLLNFELKYTVTKDIIKYSGSLASICHSICHNMCYEAGVKRTPSKSIEFDGRNLKVAVFNYIKSNSDSYREVLDKALKQRKGEFENVRVIFTSFLLLTREKLTFNEIYSDIQRRHTTYPRANLNSYLKKLCGPDLGEIIRYDANSGKYSFTNPFFRAFVQMSFDSEKDQIITKAPAHEEILKKFMETIGEGGSVTLSISQLKR